jgi:transposase
VNLLIKKVKRVGHGFRNLGYYRLRLLLYCGVTWQTHQTARLRGHFHTSQQLGQVDRR